MNEKTGVSVYHKVRTNTSGKKQCPICSNGNIRFFLETNPIPIHTHLLWQKREDAVSAPMGDFSMGFCESCGHIFNTAFNSDLLHYSQWFENSLHPASRFQSFNRLEIDHLIEKYGMHAKSVLEIGRGSGEYALLFSELAENHSTIFQPCDSDGYTTPSGLEFETYIRECSNEPFTRFQADLICCQDALEQSHRPREFVANLRHAIGERYTTIGYFQVHDGLAMLRDDPFRALSYENFSLFTPSSLGTLFAANGFQILQQRSSVEEKTLIIEVSPMLEGTRQGNPETAYDLNEVAREVKDIQQKFFEWIGALKERLNDLNANGKKVAFWGADWRGATILNTLHAHETVKVVVDPDFNKQELHISGTGHRVVTPGHLTTLKPDVLLIADPAHDQEIRFLVSAMQLSPEFITI